MPRTATMLEMFRALLSVLLLGMIPSPGLSLPHQAIPLTFDVAPPAAALAGAPGLSASGVVVLDIGSGQQIYGQQADVQRPMASLTKMMTALIIVENHGLDEVVTIPQEAAAVAGNRTYLPVGEGFTVGDLLSAILIPSGNDAAVALAIYHSGSVDAFVEKMNRRAATLGLKGTSYANPAGLDHPTQWSTPQDVAWLTVFALRHQAIADRMSKTSTVITGTSGTKITLTHTHALLHTVNDVIGGKTGTTGAAGECLVSVVGEAGHPRYIIVLLQSSQRYADMRSILRTLPSLDGATAITSSDTPPKAG